MQRVNLNRYLTKIEIVIHTLDMQSVDVGIKPLDGYILIEPFEETNQNGVVLPPSLQKNRNRGTIIAVCETLTNSYATAANPKIIEVKVGDQVYVKDYFDAPVEIGDKKYFFVNYEHILGVQK